MLFRALHRTETTVSISRKDLKILQKTVTILFLQGKGESETDLRSASPTHLKSVRLDATCAPINSGLVGWWAHGAEQRRACFGPPSRGTRESVLRNSARSLASSSGEGQVRLWDRCGASRGAADARLTVELSWIAAQTRVQAICLKTARMHMSAAGSWFTPQGGSHLVGYLTPPPA